MTRIVEQTARDAKIAELKRLITKGDYASMEMLEDAVDAFLWSEQDRLQQELLQQELGSLSRQVARSHPK